MTEARDPALVARMEALVRWLSEHRVDDFPAVSSAYLTASVEARGIVALLPEPVDLDLLLAREVAAGVFLSDRCFGDATVIGLGERDDDIVVRTALAAIRRVREQERG